LLAEDDPEDPWLELFLVDLAGMRRSSAAVAHLHRKLGDVDGDLDDGIADALVRIGDRAVAALIRKTYLLRDFNYRVVAGSILGRLTLPEAEEAALELLDGDDDQGSRTWLSFALCKLGSQRGLDKVRQIIAANSYDPTITDLREDVLTSATILGVTFPEADVWRKEAELRERRRASEQRRMFERSAQRLAQLERGHRLLAEAQARTGARVTKYGTTRPAWAPAPPATTTERVGRNQPCPCGSGKKFKQCCLKRR
jgi:HEAT repeat protein